MGMLREVLGKNGAKYRMLQIRDTGRSIKMRRIFVFGITLLCYSGLVWPAVVAGKLGYLPDLVVAALLGLFAERAWYLQGLLATLLQKRLVVPRFNQQKMLEFLKEREITVDETDPGKVVLAFLREFVNDDLLIE